MQKKSPAEILAYLMGYGFAPLAYLFLQASAFGAFNNDYATAAAAAPVGFKVLGTILFGATIVWGFGTFADKNYVSKSPVANVIILVAIAVASLLAHVGFAV